MALSLGSKMRCMSAHDPAVAEQVGDGGAGHEVGGVDPTGDGKHVDSLDSHGWMVGAAMHRFRHDRWLGWGRPCSAYGRASCPVRSMRKPAWWASVHGGACPAWWAYKFGCYLRFEQGLSSRLTCLDDRLFRTPYRGAPVRRAGAMACTVPAQPALTYVRIARPSHGSSPLLKVGEAIQDCLAAGSSIRSHACDLALGTCTVLRKGCDTPLDSTLRLHRDTLGQFDT